MESPLMKLLLMNSLKKSSRHNKSLLNKAFKGEKWAIKVLREQGMKYLYRRGKEVYI